MAEINEEDVKNFITIWVKSFKINVWWEKKNKWNYPVFTKSGKKPDLILANGIKHWAVEVKNSNAGDSNINDSFTQILTYAKDDTKYYFNKTNFKVDGYFIATQNSIKGHLFNNEKLSIPDVGRKWAIEHGELPRNEFDSTKQFLRLLWRQSKDKGIELPIGVLLCDCLNNEKSIRPLLLFKFGKNQQYLTL